MLLPSAAPKEMLVWTASPKASTGHISQLASTCRAGSHDAGSFRNGEDRLFPDPVHQQEVVQAACSLEDRMQNQWQSLLLKLPVATLLSGLESQQIPATHSQVWP